MPDIYLKKIAGVLAPADEASEDIIKKMPVGRIMKLKYSLPRNYQFLKKWFALLKVGFDNWEPAAINSKYGAPQKNFDRFRADVTILAGFYETTVRLDGSIRVEPASVSFAKMTEDQFADLYSKTIDVLLKHVYDSNMTEEQLREVVDEYLRFA